MRNSLSFAVICRVIANLFGVLTAFVSIKLYNLYVSKEVYGTILVGLSIIGYLPMMNGGFRVVLNQRMLAEKDTAETEAIARFGQTLQTYFLIVALLSGVLGMAAYGQLPKSRELGIPIMALVCTGAAAAVNFLAGGQLALLVAFGEQVKSSIIQGVWGVVSLAILWTSFSLGSGIWAFPITSGLGAALVVLAVRIALHWTKNHVPLFVWHRERDFWIRFKVIWRPAFDCLHNQFATMLVFNLDLIYVGVFIGPGPAAVYGVVSRIMGIARQVLQSLSEAAWPRLTQELDGQRKAQMMRKVDRLNAWFVGCWYGAMFITLHPFLTSLVKYDWVASTTLTSLIIVRHFLISLMSPHAYGLMSAGRFLELAKITQREVIIGAVAGLILSLTSGVNGTAIGFLIATIAVTGWQLTRGYFQFAHDTHWFQEWLAVSGRALIGGTVSMGIAAFLWHVEQSKLGTAGWLAIPAGGIACAIPAGAVLAWWRLAKRIP